MLSLSVPSRIIRCGRGDWVLSTSKRSLKRSVVRTASTLKITLNLKDHLTFRFYLTVQEPMSTCPSNRGSHMLWTNFYYKGPTILLLRGGLLADLVWAYVFTHSFIMIFSYCMCVHENFFFLQHCAWFWNRNTSHNFEFDKKMYHQRPQSIIWIKWVCSRVVWTQRTPKAWVYLEGTGGMIPWKVFNFGASEINCLFSSPQYVDGRWTCAGFLSLSICTGRIFISQIQPTTPLSEVKWLTSSKLLCCWPVSWCFWG